MSTCWNTDNSEEVTSVRRQVIESSYNEKVDIKKQEKKNIEGKADIFEYSDDNFRLYEVEILSEKTEKLLKK